eukprot:COSAG05_NODE_42_length_26187_cov_393.972286_4_plen_126_part_00
MSMMSSAASKSRHSLRAYYLFCSALCEPYPVMWNLNVSHSVFLTTGGASNSCQHARTHGQIRSMYYSTQHFGAQYNRSVLFACLSAVEGNEPVHLVHVVSHTQGLQLGDRYFRRVVYAHFAINTI